MSDADFDSVTAIAAERADIGICMSSTPTGRRSQFYKACTDPAMGLTKIWAVHRKKIKYDNVQLGPVNKNV